MFSKEQELFIKIFNTAYKDEEKAAQELELFLKSHPAFDASFSVNIFNDTVLHKAVNASFEKIVPVLCTKIPANIPNIKGKTPLHIWATSGKDFAPSKVIADTLISFGASITTEDLEGNTPVHDAAKVNSYVALTYFLEKDATLVSSVNYNQETPLHLVMFAPNAKRFSKTVLAFKKAHADMSAKDCNGDTPLHKLALAPFVTSADIDFLLIAGADPAIKNNAGETPLQALSARQKSAMTANSLEYKRTTRIISKFRHAIHHAKLNKSRGRNM